MEALEENKKDVAAPGIESDDYVEEEEGVSWWKVDVLRKLKTIKDLHPSKIDCEFRKVMKEER